MRHIKGCAIYMAFLFGIGIMIGGKSDTVPRFWGVVLLVCSWAAARMLRDAWSLNGCGTHYYGEVDSPQGTILTKWFCFFFVPVIPIQSFHLLESNGHLEGPDHYTRSLTQRPYAGLGFYWPSVRRTALWIVPGFVALYAISYWLRDD
jgi:hypothetical protein